MALFLLLVLCWLHGVTASDDAEAHAVVNVVHTLQKDHPLAGGAEAPVKGPGDLVHHPDTHAKPAIHQPAAGEAAAHPPAAHAEAAFHPLAAVAAPLAVAAPTDTVPAATAPEGAAQPPAHPAGKAEAVAHPAGQLTAPEAAA
eukprot:EG_transcript_45974